MLSFFSLVVKQGDCRALLRHSSVFACTVPLRPRCFRSQGWLCKQTRLCFPSRLLRMVHSDAVAATVLTIVLSNTTRANVQAVAAAPACADLYVARAQVHLKKDDFTSVMCSLIFCDLPSMPHCTVCADPAETNRPSNI